MPDQDGSKPATDSDMRAIVRTLWPLGAGLIARLGATGATRSELAEAYAGAMAAKRVRPAGARAAAAFDVLAPALDEDLRASLLEGHRE